MTPQQYRERHLLLLLQSANQRIETLERMLFLLNGSANLDQEKAREATGPSHVTGFTPASERTESALAKSTGGEHD